MNDTLLEMVGIDKDTLLAAGREQTRRLALALAVRTLEIKGAPDPSGHDIVLEWAKKFEKYLLEES